MVSPVQEESVDLEEEREKLAPLALLDPLDSLDLQLVPFTQMHFIRYQTCCKIGSEEFHETICFSSL